MKKTNLKEIKYNRTLRKKLRPVKQKYIYLKKEILFLHRFISVYGLKRLFIRPTNGETIKQKILSFEFSFMHINNLEDFKNYLRSKKIRFREGAFSIYLDPIARGKIFPDLKEYYPPQTGIKIIKAEGKPDSIKYANKKLLPNGSKIAIYHLPFPAEQVSLINYMASLNFSPYCYDLLQLVINGKLIFTAFILEHIEEELMTKEECLTFIQKLRNEINKKEIGLTLPNWENHMDFKYPKCNYNLIKDKQTKQLKYVDFQNFFFVDKKDLFQRKIKEAIKDTHFGEAKLVMGGKHLYQSIPGTTKGAKRNTDERFSKFVAILEENNISLKEKLILDIGCNTGMILANCLAKGAWWGIGLDRPHVIKHARIILNLLGFSRVNLFSAQLNKNTKLNYYIPTWIDDNKIENCIIFYLAVRGHFGFISTLYSMPWKVLIYEGHQDEKIEDTKKYLNDFASKSKSSLQICQMYEDSTTTPRPIALLIRSKQKCNS